MLPILERELVAKRGWTTNEDLLDYDYTDNNDELENIIDHIEEVFETEDNED